MVVVAWSPNREDYKVDISAVTSQYLSRYDLACCQDVKQPFEVLLCAPFSSFSLCTRMRAHWCYEPVICYRSSYLFRRPMYVQVGMPICTWLRSYITLWSNPTYSAALRLPLCGTVRAIVAKPPYQLVQTGADLYRQVKYCNLFAWPTSPRLLWVYWIWNGGTWVKAPVMN